MRATVIIYLMDFVKCLNTDYYEMGLLQKNRLLLKEKVPYEKRLCDIYLNVGTYWRRSDIGCKYAYNCLAHDCSHDKCPINDNNKNLLNNDIKSKHFQENYQ